MAVDEDIEQTVYDVVIDEIGMPYYKWWHACTGCDNGHLLFDAALHLDDEVQDQLEIAILGP